MFRYSILFILILPFFLMGFAQAKNVGKKGPAYFQDCPSKAKKSHDCSLEIGKYKLRIWNEKIFYQSPGDRILEDLPLKGEKIEWDEVKGQMVGTRAFLFLVLWGEPVGVGEVEAATLYIYEIGRSSVAKKIEKVIGRRKRVMKVVDGQNVMKKFEKDPRLKYRIYAAGGKVNWEIGKEKGSF